MKTYTGFGGVRAICYDCSAQFYSRNALGLAAQHAKKYKHEISVELVRIVRFNGKE